MHFRLKKTMTQVSVLTALLPSLPLLVNQALAHERPVAAKLDPATAPARGAYAYHAGQTVVRTGVTGECVTTGTWTPEGATLECHPDVFASPSAAGRSAPEPTAAAASSAADETSSTSTGATPAAAAAATGAAAASASAADTPVAAAAGAPIGQLDPSNAPERGAYVYDSSGMNVRTGVTGECVKTGTWTYESATVVCHPELFATPVARAAEPPAPVEEAPAAAAVPADTPAEEPAPATEYEPMQYAEQPAPEEEAQAAGAAGAVEEQDFHPQGDDPDLLPVPPADSFPAEPEDDGMGDPVMYYDEEEGVAQDDGIVEQHQFGDDDSGLAQDDGIVEQHQFGDDDSGLAQDDGIVGHHQFDDDDSGLAQDDDIVEDEQATEDDSGLAQDDDVVSEAEPFAEEEETIPWDLTVESTDFPEEPVAEAEAPQPAAEPAPTEEPEAAPEPEPAVAEAAEPAVAQAEPEPIILPVTITLEAEALFDFDRSRIRSRDRERLDNLIAGLKEVDYDRILVVGHADRIGTEAYNEHLSLRRANAVKDYLVREGIEASRITTEGRGEFEPSTDPEVCQGLRKQKLIDCLQPDRRVEITVTGQRQEQ